MVVLESMGMAAASMVGKQVLESALGSSIDWGVQRFMDAAADNVSKKRAAPEKEKAENNGNASSSNQGKEDGKEERKRRKVQPSVSSKNEKQAYHGYKLPIPKGGSSSSAKESSSSNAMKHSDPSEGPSSFAKLGSQEEESDLAMTQPTGDFALFSLHVRGKDLPARKIEWMSSDGGLCQIGRKNIIQMLRGSIGPEGASNIGQKVGRNTFAIKVIPSKDTTEVEYELHNTGNVNTLFLNHHRNDCILMPGHKRKIWDGINIICIGGGRPQSGSREGKKEKGSSEKIQHVLSFIFRVGDIFGASQTFQS